MSEPKDVIARMLAHDVGKYVARAARNFPASGPIPRALVDMLQRDLFGPSPSGVTPRARFEALALELASTDARITAVRAHFMHAASFELELPLASEKTVRALAADALAIEAALDGLAKDLSR